MKNTNKPITTQILAKTLASMLAAGALLTPIAALLAACEQPTGGSGNNKNTPVKPEAPVPDLVKKGEITEYGTSAKIPVYQATGVTDSAMTADLANLTAGYDAVDTGKRTSLQGKVSAIHIVPTTSNGYYEYEVKNGKVILKIKTGLSSGEIEMSFTDFVDNDLGTLTLAQSLSREAFKMAFDNASTAKETVRAAFLSTRQNVM